MTVSRIVIWKICSSWYRSTACCRAPYSAPRSHVWRPCKPSAAVCVSVSGVTSIKTADEALLLKSKALSINVSIPFTNITKELCEYVHSKGMYVKTWTYNRDTYMEEAFEKGADYVIVKNIIPSSNVRGDESEENED